MLAVLKLLTEALSRKDSLVWYVAPYYKQAKMIAWEMMNRIIPKEAISGKPNETDLIFKLRNGSQICLKGADNQDSLVGVGLQYVVMDEFALTKSNVFPKIVRPMLLDTGGKALFISTPRGKNHFWEMWMKGKRKEDGYSSYQFKTSDNPFITESEIEEAKRDMSDRFFKQEHEASFQDFTGLIYPEFDQKIHVIEPFAIPSHYETLGAIDTAISGTTAVLYGAFDEDGNLVITGEYYEQNKRVSEVCDSIRGKCHRWIIDPAAKIRTQRQMGDIFSLFDEYAENGVYATPAENDVKAGINRLGEYFKKPNGIKIFNTCKNLINELERYHWSEERETVSGMLEPKPFKSLDHACDCLRYLAMSREKTKKPDILKSIDFSKKYFEDMEKQFERFEEAI